MSSIPKYLTVDEFVARAGEEAEQLAGTGLRDNRTIDREKIAVQLVHADSVIDGYVRARYPRPFAVIPEVLKGIAFDLGRWRLRGKGGQQTAMNDAVQARYDEAMRQLRDVANGRLVLDVDGDDNLPEPGTHADTMRGTMPAARMGDVLEGWR